MSELQFDQSDTINIVFYLNMMKTHQLQNFIEAKENAKMQSLYTFEIKINNTIYRILFV